MSAKVNFKNSFNMKSNISLIIILFLSLFIKINLGAENNGLAVKSYGRSKGYQLYPTHSGMWPGAYRDLTSPRIGSFDIHQPYLTFSNVVSSNSQAGKGAVFSHEFILIEKKYEALLLNTTGEVLARFDLRNHGYQAWPVRTRSYVKKLRDGVEIALIFKNGIRFEFSKVTRNHNGNPLYLLSSITSQGGKRTEIKFSWDKNSQTPEYKYIGTVEVIGSLKNNSGSLVFNNVERPLASVSYSFSDELNGNTLEVKDVAGALISAIKFNSNDKIKTITDRYGYSTNFQYSDLGWIEKICNPLNVCSSVTYGEDYITYNNSVTPYPTMVSFENGLIAVVRAMGVEATYSYKKTSDKWNPYVLTSFSNTSESGSSNSQRITYDNYFRVKQVRTNFGESNVKYSNNQFNEPKRVVNSLFDKIISDVEANYDEQGRVIELKDNLADQSTIPSNVKFKYDRFSRIIEIASPNYIETFDYTDRQNPDLVTKYLVNGAEGYSINYNDKSVITRISAIPSGEEVSYELGEYQEVLRAIYRAANGNKYTTDMQYQAPGYPSELNYVLQLSDRNINLFSSQIRWDQEFRNPIRLATYDPNHKEKPTGPNDNPLWYQVRVPDVMTGKALPKGTRDDADGCSPCSVQNFKDEEGVTHPFSSAQARCDGNSCWKWPPKRLDQGLDQ